MAYTVYILHKTCYVMHPLIFFLFSYYIDVYIYAYSYMDLECSFELVKIICKFSSSSSLFSSYNASYVSLFYSAFSSAECKYLLLSCFKCLCNFILTAYRALHIIVYKYRNANGFKVLNLYSWLFCFLKVFMHNAYIIGIVTYI